MGATKEYPQDIYSAISSLEKQMERLAMKSPGPFDSIEVGDGTITTDNGDVILTDDNGTTVIGSSQVTASPTDVEVTTGTEVNESWARVAWTAPVGSVAGYEIVTAIPGQGVVRTDVVDPIFTQIQIQPLQPGQEYSFMVRSLGVTRSSDYVVATPDPITIGNDTTIPNVPTGFQMFGGFRSVYGIWNESTDYDVEKGKGSYEFEIDIVSTFNSGNQKTWTGKALIGPHLNLLPGVNTYYGRLRSRDSSGNPSAWTSTLSVATSQTTVNDVGNGTLVTNHFIVGTLHGSVVEVDSLHGDRLIANSADINVLKTGSLTSQIVTIEGTAMLRIGRTAPPYNYILESASSGIQFFTDGTAPFTGGDLKVDLNIVTGGAHFTGTIAGGTMTSTLYQTDSTGPRITLADWEESGIPVVAMYTGETVERPGLLYSAAVTIGGGAKIPQTSLVSPILGAYAAEKQTVFTARGRTSAGGSAEGGISVANWFKFKATETIIDINTYNGSANNARIYMDGPASTVALLCNDVTKLEVKLDRVNLWTGISMQSNPIWGPTAGSIARIDFGNNITVTSINTTRLSSHTHNVLLRVGLSGAKADLVDNAGLAYRVFEADVVDMCDGALKDEVGPAPWVLDDILQTSFAMQKRKSGGATMLGFAANKAPEYVTEEAGLTTGKGKAKRQMRGSKPNASAAWALTGIQNLHQRVTEHFEELTARVVALENREP